MSVLKRLSMLKYGMEITSLTETEQIMINMFISLVLDRFDIESIYLFGSRARSSGHTESDIDIAIIVNDDLSVKKMTRNIIDLSILVEEEAGVAGELMLSPIVLTKLHLSSSIGLGKKIMEEGVLLWSKRSKTRKGKPI